VSDWTVELRPAARKELRQLEDGPRRSAAFVIEELAEEGPELTGAIPMRGYTDTWRVRFHNERFRMVYRVFRKRWHERRGLISDYGQGANFCLAFLTSTFVGRLPLMRMPAASYPT